jgi:cyanophycinase-like exopeptidase
MGRIVQDRMAADVRSIGVDERSAALVDGKGNVQVVGTGSGAYFFHPNGKPETCAKGKPLTYHGISVYKIGPGATFNLSTWSGSGGISYRLDVEDGVVRSTRPGGSLYQ